MTEPYALNNLLEAGAEYRALKKENSELKNQVNLAELAVRVLEKTLAEIEKDVQPLIKYLDSCVINDVPDQRKVMFYYSSEYDLTAGQLREKSRDTFPNKFNRIQWTLPRNGDRTSSDWVVRSTGQLNDSAVS